MTQAAEISHLGGELPLSVKGVQAPHHDVCRLLQRHGAGRLVQGPLLHLGVEGHSSGSAVARTAAFRGRRRISILVYIACLDTRVTPSAPPEATFTGESHKSNSTWSTVL